ncbi:MAG: hypothetical protein AAF196_08960 [Planctomycetota bacterium]
MAALHAAQFAQEHGRLPAAGELRDQTKDFQLAMNIVGKLTSQHHKREIDAANKN